MITYTVVIEQLDGKRCSVQFGTKRDNETQGELQDAEIVAEHLRAASDEITARYATNGPVNVLDGAQDFIPELKEEIRRRGTATRCKHCGGIMSPDHSEDVCDTCYGRGLR